MAPVKDLVGGEELWPVGGSNRSHVHPQGTAVGDSVPVSVYKP